MKVKGWTLELATVHGIRVWRHESGALEVKGFDGMTKDQIDEFIDWTLDCALARELVNVDDWLVSDTDLGVLLEMDADNFLEEAINQGNR